jgi:microcystin-dependent protein
MVDNFLGEIRMFSGNFAPLGWALCNGQLMAISQNTALFSLLGTMYGGDGRVTFALPDLQCRVPLDWGQGPGLTDRVQGEEAGEENVTLIQSEMPIHIHQINVENAPGNNLSPANNYPAESGRRDHIYQPSANTTMNVQALGVAGGSLPHNNMQPYLVVNFIIALQGIYPQRG